MFTLSCLASSLGEYPTLLLRRRWRYLWPARHGGCCFACLGGLVVVRCSLAPVPRVSRRQLLRSLCVERESGVVHLSCQQRLGGSNTARRAEMLRCLAINLVGGCTCRVTSGSSTTPKSRISHPHFPRSVVFCAVLSLDTDTRVTEVLSRTLRFCVAEVRIQYVKLEERAV